MIFKQLPLDEGMMGVDKESGDYEALLRDELSRKFESAWREVHKDAASLGEPPKPPPGAFHFDTERLWNVGQALEGRDISGCQTSDIKHASEVLARLVLMNDLAPGFLDGMFSLFIPQFVRRHNKSALAAMAQRKANEEGFGKEWDEAIKAGMSYNKKDYLAKMMAVLMKSQGMDETQAIAAIAEQSDQDIEDIKRQIRRSNKRHKT